MNNAKERTSFETEQDRIERQQDEMRVLELMVQFQNRTDEGSFTDGLLWTVEMIAEQLIDMDSADVKAALISRLRKGHVERRGQEWFITPDGKEAFRDDIKSTHLMTGSSFYEFKNEALTGMDRDGNRTALHGAALPSLAEHGRENKEEMRTLAQCAQAQRVREISDGLEMDYKETAKGLCTGRVRWCKGTAGVEPHYGVFHGHGGKDGQRWQSLCMDCRKKQRLKR